MVVFEGGMRSIIAVSLACALFTGAAHAQNVTSSTKIGGWTVRCTVDGMTDKTRCLLLSEGTQVDGSHRISMLWQETTSFPSLRFASDAGNLGEVVVRVDRQKPVSIPICDDRARICMPGLSDEEALAQQVAKGAKLLLRTSLTDGSRDYLFDLSKFDDAVKQFRKLRDASGELLAAHPVDALEITEIDRLAAAEELARKRDDEAKAVMAIQDAIGGTRARCISTFQAKKDQLSKCVSMVTYCSQSPAPESAKQFSDCFSIWFPESRFQTVGQ